MYNFNVKEHNRKILEMSKAAASGIYPSRKVATIGSIVGLICGFGLIIFGLIGIFTKSFWGISTSFAGVITTVSNIYNLKRIKKVSQGNTKSNLKNS